MLTALSRRRGPWEVARSWAAAAQQAAPLASSAAGGAAAAGAAAAAPSGSAGAKPSAAGVQAEDVQQLRSVLSRYARRPRWKSRRGGSAEPLSHLGPPPSTGTALSPHRLARDHRPVMALPLTAEARQARQDQSVWINKSICRRFDSLDRQLTAGMLAPAERAAAGQQCLDAVADALHYVMDDVNMSTFFHRISRMVGHPEMAAVRSRLDTSRVMPVLVQRFEALLDRIIRQEAKLAGADSVAQVGPPARLPLSLRSLAASFWALGHMRYPLTQEQLDKIAAVIMLKYGELKPHHISMFLVALNAYGNTPFEGKLLKVLLERTAHMPIAEFEARTLLNIMCAAGSAGVPASQAVMDHLSLAALAFLPEVEHTHLGSLVWSLGKLGTKLGAARIHTPVLHAVVATAWRRLHDLTPDALCNTLYGFGLLNFHPGSDFLDAAAARFKELLPYMSAQQVGNCVWSFARLEYSPDAERDTWAISSSTATGLPRTAAGYTHLNMDEERDSEPEEAEAPPPRQGPPTLRQRRRSVGLTNTWMHMDAGKVARKVAAARVRREALQRLVAHAQQAVAAALARCRGARPGEPAGEAAQPVGRAVNELWMADLVHFICTGSATRPRSPRVLPPPFPGGVAMEVSVNRHTGITHVQPFYMREQFCELLMLPTVPPWKRAQRAAEEAVPAGDQLLEDVQRADEAAERQHAEATAAAASAAEAAAAAAAAAAGGELESLDAFLQQAAGEEAAPAGASDAAENMLEDPELAGSSEAAAGGGSAPREAPAAIAAEIDLDAVQEAEEAEEEEAERRQAAAASAAAQQDAAQGAEQSEGEESEEGRSLYPSSEGFGQRALAGEVSRAEERRLRRLDRLKARQEAMGDRWQPAGEQRQPARGGGGGGEPPRGQHWRGRDLSPAQLLDLLLADGSLLSVPKAVKRRWQGAERATLDDAAARCIPLAPRMSGGEVGTLMWAYATMRHVHPGLFKALLERADDLAGSLTWRGIAIVMWACAVTRQAPPRPLADRLVERYMPLFHPRMAQGVDLHSLANVAWGLTVFDYLTPDRFAQLTGMVPPHDAAALDSVNTAAWCQLFQCALYLEAKTGQHYSAFLPPHILPYAEKHWQARDTTTSRLQNKVADVLHSLEVPFAEEYSPRANFFGIDIAIQGSNGVRLAVEVDGPQHFSSNPPHMPLASTYMRNKLLAMHGWEVVSIPFNEWARLAGLQEKQDYLREHVLSKLGDQHQ